MQPVTSAKSQRSNLCGIIGAYEDTLAMYRRLGLPESKKYMRLDTMRKRIREHLDMQRKMGNGRAKTTG